MRTRAIVVVLAVLDEHEGQTGADAALDDLEQRVVRALAVSEDRDEFEAVMVKTAVQGDVMEASRLAHMAAVGEVQDFVENEMDLRRQQDEEDIEDQPAGPLCIQCEKEPVTGAPGDRFCSTECVEAYDRGEGQWPAPERDDD